MKRSPRPDIAAAEAARVGEELREARLSLGASVEDVAERLRINRRYIHALEEGRLKDLPGPAYAVGFVRSYAAALGLDSDEAVRRFRDMTGGGGTAKNGELVFPEPVPSRGVPAGALVAVGAVLAVGAYVAWFNWSGSGDRIVDAVPPVPPRLEQAAPQGPPSSPEPAPGTAAAPPAAPASRTQAVAAPATGVAAAPSAPATAAPPPPPAEASGPASISLRARGDSWVQVRDTQANQVLLDRVLRNGDTFQVPAREGLVLTTGKAENLDILVNGEPSPVLGGATGVRRGISLDASRLRPAEGAAASTRPGEAAPGPRPAPPRP